jgi:hypothetical protein
MSKNLPSAIPEGIEAEEKTQVGLNPEAQQKVANGCESKGNPTNKSFLGITIPPQKPSSFGIFKVPPRPRAKTLGDFLVPSGELDKAHHPPLNGTGKSVRTLLGIPAQKIEPTFISESTNTPAQGAEPASVPSLEKGAAVTENNEDKTDDNGKSVLEDKKPPETKREPAVQRGRGKSSRPPTPVKPSQETSGANGYSEPSVAFDLPDNHPTPTEEQLEEGNPSLRERAAAFQHANDEKPGDDGDDDFCSSPTLPRIEVPPTFLDPAPTSALHLTPVAPDSPIGTGVEKTRKKLAFWAVIGSWAVIGAGGYGVHRLMSDDAQNVPTPAVSAKANNPKLEPVPQTEIPGPADKENLDSVLLRQLDRNRLLIDNNDANFQIPQGQTTNVLVLESSESESGEWVDYEGVIDASSEGVKLAVIFDHAFNAEAWEKVQFVYPNGKKVVGDENPIIKVLVPTENDRNHTAYVYFQGCYIPKSNWNGKINLLRGDKLNPSRKIVSVQFGQCSGN